MPFGRRHGLFESGRVLQIPVTAIVPNPSQPRQTFAPEGLEELSSSIAQLGILQPLSLRRLDRDHYELVSGERRLRAAKLCGLTEVPCIVLTVDETGSSLLALVENLQRRDLDFVEEALALAQLLRSFDLSQEEVARRIGKSQSAVANKLRLLRLSPDALTLLRVRGYTERHARALLKLPSEEEQLSAAQYVVEKDLTVAETEAYVAFQLLPPTPQAEPHRPAAFILKDIRLFLNTLDRNLALVRSAGVAARYDRSDTEGEILLTIHIAK
ncbi:MAG: ParB/RepB/Spo0J family partition protein [Oscillospiraceae bacterium]